MTRQIRAFVSMLFVAALLPLAACALDPEDDVPGAPPGGAAVGEDVEANLTPDVGAFVDERRSAPDDPDDDAGRTPVDGLIMERRADGSRTIYRVNRDGAVVDRVDVAATADTNDWEESQYQVVLTIYDAERFSGRTYYFLTPDTNNVSSNVNFPTSFRDKMRSYVVAPDCKVAFYLNTNQMHQLGVNDRTGKSAYYASTTAMGQARSVRISCGVTPQPRGFAYADSGETGSSLPFFGVDNTLFDLTLDAYGSWDTQISSYDLKVSTGYLLASTLNGGRYGVLGDIINLPPSWNDRTTRVRIEDRNVDTDFLGCSQARTCYTNVLCDPGDTQRVGNLTFQQCQDRHYQDGRYRSYCNDMLQCITVPGGSLQIEI